MRAIILAAGQGTRLQPETNTKPKCLVDVGGSSILAHQLRGCARARFTDAVVVTGFEFEQVEQEVAKLEDALGALLVYTVYNPFFDVSNNLISLWAARHMADREFVLINGDDVFDPEILVRLSDATGFDAYVSTDRKASYDDDDMKVVVEDGMVRHINKKIPSGEAQGESIGIMRFTSAGAKRLLDELERMVRTATGLSDWYTKAIERIAHSGFEVGAVDIHGLQWAEIDFPEDLRRVRETLGHLITSP